MRSLLAAILIVLLATYPAAAAQTTQPPAPIVQSTPTQAAPVAPLAPVPAANAIVVPAGTLIPLTLVSPIRSLSTKPGDTVRATVAFPILIGAQVAIPAGTYVEGIVNTVERQDKKTHQPLVQIHFTRLLYASGYIATLDAANSASVFLPPSPAGAEPQVVNASYDPSSSTAHFAAAAYAEAPHAYPDPPPFDGSDHPLHIILPSIFGFLAVMTGLFILLHHHAGTVAKNTDWLIWDTGSQFQMTLTTPLIVDGSKVNLAAQAMNAI